MSRSTLVACAVACAFVPASGAVADPFLRLDDYDDHELQVVGFELARPTQVKIEAEGVDRGSTSWRWGRSRGFTRNFRWGSEDDDRGPLATAWILDSATRKVVWSQDESRDKRSGRDREDDRWTVRNETTVELQPGRYELYAWAGWPWGDNVQIFGLHGLHDAIFSIDSRDRRGNTRLRRAFRDCFVQLSSDAVRADDVARFEPSGEIAGSVYRAAGLGDEAFVRAGFTVDRALSIRVYALGEMPFDWRHPADGGWIVNRDTRERVWEAGGRDFDAAGGADKNRVFDQEIALEPGSYELCYGTDDSHSKEEWNAAPPYDPLNWGVTILPGKGFDSGAFHVQGELVRGDAVVDLTRARDDDVLEKRFRLARDTDVQIYALGEWNDGADEFADGGWISEARSGRVVWEMTDRNTTAAGGAEKNRMFDGVVRLPAGDYIAHYETDDSHAYRRWNASAPWDRNAWGLALYPGRGASAADFQASDVSTADIDGAGAKGDALVAIVRVRDNADRSEKFTLDSETRLHIRALGEGQDRELYDYAWIEDDRGRVVWEMTWRNTRHAGGASKNRIFDDEIRLDAGTYEVHYVSDGSHSYRNWNARKPRDPEAWGVTITRAGR